MTAFVLQRRRFLTALASALWSSQEIKSKAQQLSHLALHLGAAQTGPARDLPLLFRTIAAIGYRDVELGSSAGDPIVLRRLLDAAGLRASSRDVQMSEVFSNWRKVLTDCRALGSRQIVCEEVPASERTTIEGYRRVGALLNSAGQITQWAGVQLALRQHPDDLRPRNRVTPFDFLLANTTPALVKFQLDLTVMKAAWRDPVADFRRYRGRFVGLHVPAGDPAPELAEVLAAARAAGVEQIVVRDDQPDPPGNRARAAFESLSRLLKPA